MGKRKFNSLEDSENLVVQNESSIPKLDEKVLSILTSKIEEGLEKQKLSENSLKSSKGDRTFRSIDLKYESNKELGSKLSKKKKISNTAAKESNRETKKNSTGKRKILDRKSSPSHYTSENVENDQKKILLREILALGGTEDDLELIASVGSHSEDEDKILQNSPPLLQKELQDELQSFINNIGIKTVAEENDEISDNSMANDSGQETSKINDSIDIGKNDRAQPEKNSSKKLVSSLSNEPNRLIFQARPDWHETSLPPLPVNKNFDSSAYNQVLINLKNHALSLLDADNQLYASKNMSSSSSQKFLTTIMASGTLSDKISALTLVVQESPVHTMKSFESLIGLAKKRSRGQAVIALAALKDLLGAGSMLPSNRRLRKFEDQPGLLGTLVENSVRHWNVGQKLPGSLSKVHLISWAYEDWLKDSYFEILKIMESWCNDEIVFARSRVVTYVYELLRDKPEQEANLLRLLVNKIGDPDRKIASRTSYLILQLQNSHPLMKPIIIRSIESEILLRPGQNLHAKYYAITTLNQTILSSKESEVAKTLLNIYFEHFVLVLKNTETPKFVPEESASNFNRDKRIQGGGSLPGKKANAKKIKEQQSKSISEETNEKMISALLTGVNRAFPFSKSDDITLESQMDTLFRITHSSNFNTSIQALILIEQLAISKNISVDRFYRTLYESLLDPRLITSSKHMLYLNLLYRALRSDFDVTRVKAFTKRMVQVITLHQPPFICGILYLLRELEEKFPGIQNLTRQPEQLESDEEVYFDIPENSDSDKEQKLMQTTNLVAKYDGKKRDPRYSNASNSCLWELIPFTTHFHPSVSLFARRLLSGEKMPPKPHLPSHSLSSFLDRFVYRNAKTAALKSKGNSIMQPLAGADGKTIFLSHKAVGVNQQPLNSETFWRQKIEDVAADEVFFHKYFSEIKNSKQATRKTVKSKAKISDGESDDGEDEIWQALVKSNPEIEGQDSDSETAMFDDSHSESSMENLDTDDDLENEGSIVSQLSFVDEYSNGSGVEIGANNVSEQTSDPKDDVKTSSKRKRTRDLPLFASVNDYASLLNDEPDEDFQ
ncbi:putative arm repeat-containing protein [Erysiphe necator]|uniref:Putative arm repeat-containing protein n=1 Tax=Uncinula necator TaxID=52586 RepID=A0A0B1P4Q9_UNCNE|nr:putative arm repeat-containing protein [Erysiphe necator]